MSDYFDELAGRLGELGHPPERVQGTIAELRDHAAAAGADPREEFGPAAEFAARLAPAGAGGGQAPEPDAATWRWMGDAFCDIETLNALGSQGWEAERIDAVGRVVTRRDPDSPMRWQYRRELYDTARRRERLAEELAPEGWEPWGHWVVFAYFKRPASAAEGPQARVTDAPPPPSRRVFVTARGWVILAAGLLVTAAALLAMAMTLGGAVADGDLFDLGATAAGAIIGALVGLGAAAAVLWAVVQVARRRKGPGE